MNSHQPGRAWPFVIFTPQGAGAAGKAHPSPSRAHLPSLPDYFLPLCALLIALLGFGWGERVEVSGGLGWDGVIYARWARDFKHEVFVQRVDRYYIQRILPSAIVHYSLRALGIARTDRNIMRAFGLLSVLLFTLLAQTWVWVARRLQISEAGKWLGFAGLFLNYVVLKHSFYCPVTTDVSAYALGMGMLACYLDRRNVLLAVLTVIGAFVWPLATYVGGLLLLFPRGRGTGVVTSPAWPLPVALAVAAALCALVGIRHVVHTGYSLIHGLVDPVYLEPIRCVYHLSLVVSVVYVGLGVFYLLRSGQLFQPGLIFSLARLRNAVLVLVLLGAVHALQVHWSNKQHFMGIQEMLAMIAFGTVAKPGIFLVAHAAYYGPLFLLLVFLWRPVCTLIHQEGGIGLTLVAALGLLLSLNSQSRYFINIYVMVLPFLIKATDSLHWRPSQYGLLGVLCLFFSKCWMTMNCGPFRGQLFEFPDQYMFMTHGPWISHGTYLVQGGVMLVGAYLIYANCLRDKSAGVEQEEQPPVRVAA